MSAIRGAGHRRLPSPIGVLLISNAITPDRAGGLERYVRQLGTALSARGADVMILARRVDPGDPERTVDPDGVEIRRFSTPPRSNPLYALGYPLASARAVLETVSSETPKRVVHGHYPLQALPLALRGGRYLYTFHAPAHREIAPERQGAYALPGPAEQAAVALMRRGESRIVCKAAKVVVLSEFMRSQAAALGARADAISLLPGGLDGERFSPGPPIQHPSARGAGPLLFTARRLVPRTGVLELVEAFAAIAARVPDARLAIAGRGALEQQLRARIRALGLEQRVLVLGWISDEELVGWYRAADLVVMPTQQLEGFGLTSAEALACGTPVLATPVGANPELLRRLDGSLITRDASPAAIAETALDLLDDRTRLNELAGRARASVWPALSWSNVADGYLELYERHLSAASATPAAAGNGSQPLDDEELFSLLRSPDSGAPLRRLDGVLESAGGEETFPVVAGVPVLLASDSPFSADSYLADAGAAHGSGAGVSADAGAGRRSRLRRVLPSLSHNLSAAGNFSRLAELLRARRTDASPARVLVVGGAIVGEGMHALLADPGIRLIEADVAIGPRTDLLCDAHTLPFADGSFDAVVCQAVLEHVADPPRVVAEIHRVLRPGGLVYSEIPFMQQVHEGAYDFTRYTYNGHRRLFRRFDQIDAGATAGPGMALGWSLRALLTAIAGEHRRARTLVNVASTLALFWLKYLDRWLIGTEAILDGASGTYYLGAARERPRSDREIIDGYRGVNNGFSARR